MYVETQDPTYVGAHLHTRPSHDAPAVALSTHWIPNRSEVEATGQPVAGSGGPWYPVTYQGTHHGYVLGSLLSRTHQSGTTAQHSTAAGGDLAAQALRYAENNLANFPYIWGARVRRLSTAPD